MNGPLYMKCFLFKAFSTSLRELQSAHDLVEQINPHLSHEWDSDEPLA